LYGSQRVTVDAKAKALQESLVPIQTPKKNKISAKGKGKWKGKNTAFKELEQVNVFTICYLYFSFSIDCS